MKRSTAVALATVLGCLFVFVSGFGILAAAILIVEQFSGVRASAFTNFYIMAATIFGALIYSKVIRALIFSRSKAWEAIEFKVIFDSMQKKIFLVLCMNIIYLTPLFLSGLHLAKAMGPIWDDALWIWCLPMAFLLNRQFNVISFFLRKFTRAPNSAH